MASFTDNRPNNVNYELCMDSGSALLFSFKDAVSKEQQWQEKNLKKK